MCKHVQLLAGVVMVFVGVATRGNERGENFTVTPASTGEQLVRTSVPLPREFLRGGETLVADDGRRKTQTAVRVLSWHPENSSGAKTVRRAMITFPYDFKGAAPVRFTVRAAHPKEDHTQFGERFELDGDVLNVNYAHGPALKLRLLGPARTSTKVARREVVEENAFYHWERFHFPDPQWPRVIEVRADALGGIVVVAHLQRNLPENGRAPDFGWEVETAAGPAVLQTDDSGTAGIQTARRVDTVAAQSAFHGYTNGTGSTLLFDSGKYCIYHPTAPLKRRGHSEKQTTDGRLHYRYWRCAAEEKVPMQSTSWQRAEIVIAPVKLARLTATLQSPQQAAVDARLWDELYATGEPLDLKAEPELARILSYHRDAIVHSMAVGDDFGNVTGYTDGQRTGVVSGMNRLNHCPPIFQEGWRSGDRRLVEIALLWCDNFYDQSIWWGEKQHGGTRYNNVIAQGRKPPDDDHTYMWRSNDSVNFCTKGYDSFWLAYEETGDPRMLEALEAQVQYATEHVHANTGECRNIGDVREFIRLYSYTGEKRYREQAMRLFQEVRTKLSDSNLFDQGGKALAANPPFIDDDEAGVHIGYAKPYIIGYALTGLPELASLAPTEPRLREVISAVADFLAESEDLLGGWRYPHPRSSYMIISQAIEHAWQLVQADRLLGPQPKHLDAIERVLRQRIIGWRQTGKIFSGLNGWEFATGKIKQRGELNTLYKKPEERDFTRDYREGAAGFGSSPPEGLVYFPDVLSYYLQHRPASRLLVSPKPEEPLGQVLRRVK